MAGDTRRDAAARWYRSPEVWLVLSPLIATVPGFLLTLYLLASSGSVDQLPGLGGRLGKVYAGQPAIGLGIHWQRDREAKSGAWGTLLFELPATVITAAGESVRTGPDLELGILHPTMSDRDQHLLLRRTPAGHAAELPEPLPERGAFWLRDPATGFERVILFRVESGRLVAGES